MILDNFGFAKFEIVLDITNLFLKKKFERRKIFLLNILYQMYL